MALRSVSAIVLDIEGTICPISFVKDTLFPYALAKLKELAPTVSYPLSTLPSQDDSEFVTHLKQFPTQHTESAQALVDHVTDLTARDIKAAYWKSLQGYLWRFGYELGEIEAPLYDDAVGNIQQWAQSHKVYIYSSGSVNAQKLLFAHVKGGIDMNKYFAGYFDTTNAGSKLDKSSYDSIAAQISTDPSNILFLSDNHLETDAALEAHWNVQLVTRPGNAPLPEGYSAISSTDQVQ